MYLAVTYQEYITEHQLNVYGTEQLDIPKPEFYVVYTGNRSFAHNTVSLRDDFFHDPGAAVDITAKVINTENKDDIIGQYIIFCHVVDEQIRKHGRTKEAIEKAISICSDSGVLKDYLDTRKKEVIDVMITLFDQGYAVEAYAHELAAKAEQKGLEKGLEQGREQGRKQGREEGREEGREQGREEGREEGIRVTVELCREIGLEPGAAAAKIASNFHIPQEDAARYVEKYWQK